MIRGLYLENGKPVRKKEESIWVRGPLGKPSVTYTPAVLVVIKQSNTPVRITWEREGERKGV
jgi:hypothetical protein